MTTIFDLKDAAILDQVEGKRRTQFTAERANGALTVTKIRSAR